MVETIEIIVYLGIAVIVGALLVGFIAGWDATAAYEGLKGVFEGPDPEAYEKISSTDLPRTVLEFWESCGLGTVDQSKTVHITDAVPLNKTLIFPTIRAASLCRTIQSADHDCGTREDILFQNASGPAVLRLACNAENRTLIITS